MTSVVYYIGARDVGRVKIGRTQNLRARLNTLSAQSIDRLTVLATEPGGSREERARHELFKHLRRHGEWFEWTQDIEDWLVAVARIRQENIKWDLGYDEDDIFSAAVGDYADEHPFAFPLSMRLMHAYAGGIASICERIATEWLRVKPDDVDGARLAILVAGRSGLIPGWYNG